MEKPQQQQKQQTPRFFASQKSPVVLEKALILGRSRGYDGVFAVVAAVSVCMCLSRVVVFYCLIVSR